jgi:hypothetical protein
MDQDFTRGWHWSWTSGRNKDFRAAGPRNVDLAHQAGR